MIGLNLGCNFSQEHVDAIVGLARKYDYNKTGIKINTVYGSPFHQNQFGSTRPLEREKPGGLFEAEHLNDLCDVYKALSEENIGINITLNSLFPRLRKSNDITNNIFDSAMIRGAFTEYVENIYPFVNAIIVANPIMIDILHEYLGGGCPDIIISTIMNVHSLAQLKEIRERWPKVKAVCPALWRNRDINWLKKAQKIIPLELLANEFCSIGGVECDGLYRQICYLNQCMDVKEFNPMTQCIKSRDGKSQSWLMARFILPQWMTTYQERTGVSNFKITGRTHSTEYISWIGDIYLSGIYTGNLLNLWGHLQATLNNEHWEDEQKKATNVVNIPCDANEVSMLLNKILNGECISDECGYSCFFCKKMWDSIKERSM